MAQTAIFTSIWSAFPDHTSYPDLVSLFRYIGGDLAKNINSPGFGPNGNTCATRMSRALNWGGFPINAGTARLHHLTIVKGGDGYFYLFRVRELKTYLMNALGPPQQVVRRGFDTAFAGQRGIVAFDVVGWTDATGHIALWDGTRFREPHDDYRSLTGQGPIVNGRPPPHVVSMSLWSL